jgi:hypothetical protein
LKRWLSRSWLHEWDEQMNQGGIERERGKRRITKVKSVFKRAFSLLSLSLSLRLRIAEKQKDYTMMMKEDKE